MRVLTKNRDGTTFEHPKDVVEINVYVEEEETIGIRTAPAIGLVRNVTIRREKL